MCRLECCEACCATSLKLRMTVLGTKIEIFARDECQKDAWNLCDNHLMLAIDKMTLTDDSERCVSYFIRTLVMEVVKSDFDIVNS